MRENGRMVSAVSAAARIFYFRKVSFFPNGHFSTKEKGRGLLRGPATVASNLMKATQKNMRTPAQPVQPSNSPPPSLPLSM